MDNTQRPPLQPGWALRESSVGTISTKSVVVMLRIVGLDCATKETSTALAIAEYCDGRVSLREVVVCNRKQTPVSVLKDWISDKSSPILIAIDAPLGWPRALSQSLIDHLAGEPICTDPNFLFRRTTDRFIKLELDKTPLDVGADRIARTAHAALQILEDTRAGAGIRIPLAWSPQISEVSAIEVYPAATLIAHEVRSTGYKEKGQIEERREILQSISAMMEVVNHAELLENNADALDAAVCILSGRDFLSGRAVPPKDLALAQQEGWIWTATRNQGRML